MPFETIVKEDRAHPVITLRDTTTGCIAVIYAFGGLLNEFSIPTDPGFINIIDGFDSVQDARENITAGFKSAKLSPFVCRMHSGAYRFNDTHHIIQKYFLDGHAIHGLLYDAVFKVTHTESSDTNASVTLEHVYDATDKGYPFPYKIAITWTLEPQNKLTVTTIVSHNNPHAIPMADGWHPYFALGGPVDEWTLQFDSDCRLEFDTNLLPTGKKITDNRFTCGSLLRGIELDNSFELFTGAALPACTLRNQKLALHITPGKTYPILQVYIPPHRKSIAIENLSGAPDNFNNGIGLVLLEPGEKKTFTTNYSVTVL